MVLIAAGLQVMNMLLAWKIENEEAWLWKLLLVAVACTVQVMIFVMLVGDSWHSEHVSQEEWDEFQRSIRAAADEDSSPEDSVVK